VLSQKHGSKVHDTFPKESSITSLPLKLYLCQLALFFYLQF